MIRCQYCQQQLKNCHRAMNIHIAKSQRCELIRYSKFLKLVRKIDPKFYLSIPRKLRTVKFEHPRWWAANASRLAVRAWQSKGKG